jgi:hypothetical protein
MSFRKRSVPLASTARNPAVSTPSTSTHGTQADPAAALRNAPGIRTSPVLSFPTTSTGTPSLDHLLGLGAGIALGHSLAIEEHGTTDFAGTLLRCFVSQGVMLGHKVFVGAGEAWGGSLPGVREEKDKAKSREKVAGETSGSVAKEVERGERMKIAWRYERLGGLDTERRGALYAANLAFCVFIDFYVAISDYIYRKVKYIASDICRSAIHAIINTILSPIRPNHSPVFASKKPSNHIYPAYCIVSSPTSRDLNRVPHRKSKHSRPPRSPISPITTLLLASSQLLSRLLSLPSACASPRSSKPCSSALLAACALPAFPLFNSMAGTDG